MIEKDTGERAGVPLLAVRKDDEEEVELTVFDCAAGGGEATVAIRGWVGRVVPELLGNGGERETGGGQSNDREEKKGRWRGRLRVYASDPFTNELYEERVNGFRKSEGVQGETEGIETGIEEGRDGGGGHGDGDGEHTETTMRQGETLGGDTSLPKSTPLSSPELKVTATAAQTQLESLSTETPSTSVLPSSTFIPRITPHPYIPCHSFSFRDISLQGLDTLLSTPPGVPLSTDDPSPLYIDLTLISFALHLCPPSELFSLLYELSRHSAYLVVIAPHKNPHIPGGGERGWVGPLMEVLVKKERVRGRVFRSVNF